MPATHIAPVPEALAPYVCSPMPGSLWYWRGNAYDVICIEKGFIVLREQGGNHFFSQCVIAGYWMEPEALPTYA